MTTRDVKCFFFVLEDFYVTYLPSNSFVILTTRLLCATQGAFAASVDQDR